MATKKKSNNKKKKSKLKMNIDVEVILLFIIGIITAILIYGKSGYMGSLLNEIFGGIFGLLK